ncbi:MAG: fibronectin type III domain-containing protein [Spirochaetaceae bacterium]|nr:fibronectin type III domain-containing protein [Spirochaetaceae bacterium]
MKKFDILILLSIIFAILFCFACQNQLLPEPGTAQQIISNNSKSWGKPEGLTSTQGLKQEIILSWTPIKDAIRYYIYRAPSPFDNFVQIGETKDASTIYTMKVPSGTDMYYKITAVDPYGNESPYSEVVRGTSLGQPTISDIVGLENQSDSTATVYWYMGNVDAYQNQVRYTVICSDSKGNEVSRILLNGSESKETSVTFENLLPHTDYSYTVEAYLVLDQNSIETSETINAATARRLRPNSPEDTMATGGVSKDYIKISFKLPELVDVAVSSDVYEQKPLFFKIYRRVKDSDDEFVPITTYFGKDPTDESLGKTNFGYTEYVPGEIVTWIDNQALERGVIYEYKIQAFADNSTRVITSDLSTSLVEGWILANPFFKTADYLAEKNEDGTAFVSSTLNFGLNWETFGKEDEYDFIIEESFNAFIGDGTTSSESQQGIVQWFDTIQDVNNFVRTFNLETDINGYYKYKLHIVPQGNMDSSSALDTVYAIGQILITKNIEQPTVKEFSILSGYSDKNWMEWDYNETYTYSIRYWEDEDFNGEGTLVSNDEIYAALEGKNTGDTIHLELETAPGTKRTYVLYATTFITKGTSGLEGSTAGIPQPRIKEYSYDSLNIEWDKVNFATSYSLSAKYDDIKLAQKYQIQDSEKIDTTNPTEYSFEKIPGYNDWTVSGLPITVKLEANTYISKNSLTLNSDGETYQKTTETLSETDSISREITTHLIGPALINTVAKKSISSDYIEVSWNKIQGASAYAVIRNRYHIAPGGIDLYKSTETYLVNTENDINVSLLGSIGEIKEAVTVTTDGTFFSLKDSSIIQTDETVSWQTSQEQIKWGCPFDYVVIPLVSSSDSPEYDYTTSPKNLTIQETTFTEIPFSRGSALGYGWNVTASKGWQITSLSGEETTAINNNIFVNWEKPVLSSTVQPSYQVYRKEEKTTTWTYLSTVETTQYIDTSADPGKVYEYVIGLVYDTEQSSPDLDEKYISFSDTKMDDYDVTEKAAAGFILPKPEITSASRDQRSNRNGYSELIKWTSIEIGNVSNRMISGYVIEVLNHNISSDWNIILDVPLSNAELMSKKLFQEEVDNSSGYLKVLRDYKHYFRIRAYREKDGKRSYSAIPDYTWSDGYENNYVKWGARQITIDEFAKAAIIGMSTGMYKSRGTEGCNDDGNDITGLNSDSSFNWGSTDYTVTLDYSSYVASHMPKSNLGEVSAVIISGTLKARGGLAGAYQTHYWTNSSMTATYNGTSGTLQFNGEDSQGGDTVSRTAGTIDVTYNGQSKTFDMGKNPGFTLPFAVKGGYLNDTEEWK